jgi:hypothetical protein
MNLCLHSHNPRDILCAESTIKLLKGQGIDFNLAFDENLKTNAIKWKLIYVRPL